MQAHRCNKRSGCDPVDMCSYSMMKEGAEKYGTSAFGPGGDHINTDEKFSVKTEFVADQGYSYVHKIRTTLS